MGISKYYSAERYQIAFNEAMEITDPTNSILKPVILDAVIALSMSESRDYLKSLLNEYELEIFNSYNLPTTGENIPSFFNPQIYKFLQGEIYLSTVYLETFLAAFYKTLFNYKLEPTFNFTFTPEQVAYLQNISVGNFCKEFIEYLILNTNIKIFQHNNYFRSVFAWVHSIAGNNGCSVDHQEYADFVIDQPVLKYIIYVCSVDPDLISESVFMKAIPKKDFISLLSKR